MFKALTLAELGRSERRPEEVVRNEIRFWLSCNVVWGRYMNTTQMIIAASKIEYKWGKLHAAETLRWVRQFACEPSIDVLGELVGRLPDVQCARPEIQIPYSIEIMSCPATYKYNGIPMCPECGRVRVWMLHNGGWGPGRWLQDHRPSDPVQTHVTDNLVNFDSPTQDLHLSHWIPKCENVAW
jgi:hypothetical protein